MLRLSVGTMPVVRSRNSAMCVCRASMALNDTKVHGWTVSMVLVWHVCKKVRYGGMAGMCLVFVLLCVCNIYTTRRSTQHRSVIARMPLCRATLHYATPSLRVVCRGMVRRRDRSGGC